MFSSIRLTFWIVLPMLILLVVILAGWNFYTVGQFRQQTLGVALRAEVLPAAGNLNENVAKLQAACEELQRIYSAQIKHSAYKGDEFRSMLKSRFSQTLFLLKSSGDTYSKFLQERPASTGSFAKESETIKEIQNSIQILEGKIKDENWISTETGLESVQTQLNALKALTSELQNYLTAELNHYAEAMKQHSDRLKTITAIFVTISLIPLGMLIGLSYYRVLKPLNTLIEGAKQVADGKYDYRFSLSATGEIGELVKTMNLMTEQFEKQVRQKSRELVRSERLASVGFLAAGVAHEINNPLMAISACAEALSRRMNGGQIPADAEFAEFAVRYLTMIQDEAFRCGEITGRLLSIARNEPAARTKTDLVPLISDMLTMTRQQNAFKGKTVNVQMPPSLEMTVNPQEIKQVVLNLLTNAFQNTAKDGTVWITFQQRNAEAAVLTIRDNGVGMEPAVLANIFEPFFTQRREGYGTGLGLSITHRIIEEHHGTITAVSGGLGKGAEFTVELPMT